LIRFEAASLTSLALEEDHWAASSYRTWVRKVCYLPGGSGSVGLSKVVKELTWGRTVGLWVDSVR